MMVVKSQLKKEVLHKLGREVALSQSAITASFMHKVTHAVGHDLRSPIFVIRAYTQLLKKNQEKERLERGFNMIQEATCKLENIVNEFVSLIDIYTTPPPSLVKVSFKTVFNRCQSELAPLIVQNQPEIFSDFSAFPDIDFNEEHLYILMACLIDNAIRHNINKQDLQIKVVTKKVGNDVVLTIADNGQGLDSPEEQDRISEAFYSLTDDPKCVGIGLSKVQAIANVSQNVFMLKSFPNQYTACSFVFKNANN